MSGMTAIPTISSRNSQSIPNEGKIDKKQSSSGSDNNNVKFVKKQVIALKPKDLDLLDLGVSYRVGRDTWISVEESAARIINVVNEHIGVFNQMGNGQELHIEIPVLYGDDVVFSEYHAIGLKAPVNGSSYKNKVELEDALSATLLARVFQALKNKKCISSFEFDFAAHRLYSLKV